MSSLGNVWIFSERPDTLGELCSAGHQIGKAVSALVIGNQGQAEQAIAAGAQRVYLLPSSPDRILEDYFPTLKGLVNQKLPDAILLQTSMKTRLLAGRLAAAIKTNVFTDVSRLWLEDKRVFAEHMVYGGAAMRIERSQPGSPCIALIGEGVFEPYSADSNRHGEVIPVEVVPPALKAKFIESRPKVGEAVNLQAARRVVGIGRGLAKQEDLVLIQSLANILEAEVGCSRPIAEGLNWMAKERYIGVSGAMLKPDIYLAIGISGQVQHMVGANCARTIIAINKDKNAPIFRQADYGIVGDLYKVIPEVIRQLKGE